MLHIIDGNNWVRRRLETSTTGHPIRECYNEIQFAPQERIQVVVWDGPHAKSPRQALYPEYKANREPAAESVYASLQLLSKLLKISRAIQIKVPKFEADDVIAHLALQYPGSWVHSNDADFAALPNTKLDREEFKIEPRWVRLYKATVGDPSDNIPGIKGFGQVSWQNCNKEHLERLIAHGDVPPWEDMGLSKAVLNWLKPENIEQVRIYYRIVGFLPVPQELIDKHTEVGVANPQAAHNIMQEYEL